jgi:hypothetical protein
MLGFDSAAIDAANALLAREVSDFQRLGGDLGRDGPPRDALGGRQIPLHQERRDGEHVADVVEAVARIVDREILVGAELDAQQIANRVGVLVAIQTMGRHPARIRFDQRIGAIERAFDVAGHRGHARGVGARDSWRGHIAGAQAPQDSFPDLAMLREGIGGGEIGNAHAARRCFVVVALRARLGEHGTNDGRELVALAAKACG